MPAAEPTKRAKKNQRRRSRKRKPDSSRMFVNHAPTRLRRTVKTEKADRGGHQHQQHQNEEVEAEGGCLPVHQYVVPESDYDDEMEEDGGHQHQQHQNEEVEAEGGCLPVHQYVVPESDYDDEMEEDGGQQQLQNGEMEDMGGCQPHDQHGAPGGDNDEQVRGEEDEVEEQQQQQHHPEQNVATTQQQPNNKKKPEEKEYEIKNVYAVYTHTNEHRAYFIGWAAYRGVHEWTLSEDISGVEIVADFTRSSTIDATLSAVLGNPVSQDLLDSLNQNSKFEKVRSQMDKAKDVRSAEFNITFAQNTPAYIRRKAEKELQAFVSMCM
uniref:Uncharacterized protein n=1 Tax=Globodera rostochiensis TaxID=31243 RepID=A0A914HYU9_GLORO